MHTLLAFLILLLALPAAAQEKTNSKKRHPPHLPSGEINCLYSYTPTVWEFAYHPLRRKVKICLARVNCTFQGKDYRRVGTLCFLEGGDCPGATECARHKDALGMKARNSRRHVVPK